MTCPAVRPNKGQGRKQNSMREKTSDPRVERNRGVDAAADGRWGEERKGVERDGKR